MDQRPRVLTAHQPAYLPWLGLFHKIALADVYVFMDHVQFSNTDKFINGNSIKSDHDKPLRLTVPMKTHGSCNFNISELEIDNSEDWRRRHFRSIRQYYARSAFGREYFSRLQEFYEKKYVYLKDLTFEMLKFFLEVLNIDTEVVKASELPVPSKKNQYFIDLCRRFDCSVFIFGAQGIDYVDKGLWADSRLNYVIQDYQHPEYPQLWGPFLSHLSILDLLLNVGPSDAKRILFEGNVKKGELV